MHRTDRTAKALIAHAEQLGAMWMPISGAIDGLLYFRGQLLMVDWKSPGGALTPTQSKLASQGWPIHFLSTPAELEAALGISPRG